MVPKTRRLGTERRLMVPMAILPPPRDQVVPGTGVRCRGPAFGTVAVVNGHSALFDGFPHQVDGISAPCSIQGARDTHADMPTSVALQVEGHLSTCSRPAAACTT
eukprot:11637406-Alexandrium_andersonii.AAC.1